MTRFYSPSGSAGSILTSREIVPSWPNNRDDLHLVARARSEVLTVVREPQVTGPAYCKVTAS